jgi:oligopeptide/dipeptide ABC transporter ATP-binding protein
VLTQTLLGLAPGGEVSGRAVFDGTNLIGLPDAQMRQFRGSQIAVIFQDPLTSLHPQFRVGWQIAEMLRAHNRSLTRAQAAEQAVELLDRVGIPQASQRARDYPHQFSGGMRQRVIIAMALSLEPKLIIADEPTTALDATVQAQILDLLLRLQAESGTALIVITHDLGVIADIADHVLVMYAGRAVEVAAKRDIFYQPHHPYTNALLESRPNSSAAGQRLRPITGQPPSLVRLPSGCPFHPRCRYVMDRCIAEEPPLRAVGGGGAHRSACWLPTAATGVGDEAEDLRGRTAAASRTQEAAKATAAITESPDADRGVIA